MKTCSFDAKSLATYKICKQNENGESVELNAANASLSNVYRTISKFAEIL